MVYLFSSLLFTILCLISFDSHHQVVAAIDHSDPMQQDESTRGHYSDPLTSRLTPLRPDFLENAPGFESRARSLSPSKRLVKQPLHIRMNLTESQVDKITDA
jgi:hypothetical protein